MRKLLLTFEDIKEYGDYDIVRGPQVFELNKIDNSSCNEILAKSCLDYIEIENRNNVLYNWISKIRKNGILTITGRDLVGVCKAYLCAEIDDHTLNSLVYNNKQSIGCSTAISQIMKSRGFKIIQNKIDNLEWCISGQRQ